MPFSAFGSQFIDKQQSSTSGVTILCKQHQKPSAYIISGVLVLSHTLKLGKGIFQGRPSSRDPLGAEQNSSGIGDGLGDVLKVSASQRSISMADTRSLRDRSLLHNLGDLKSFQRTWLSLVPPLFRNAGFRHGILRQSCADTCILALQPECAHVRVLLERAMLLAHSGSHRVVHCSGVGHSWVQP